MNEEALNRAWELNGPFVKHRNDLTDDDIRLLQGMEVVPLPNGWIEASPATLVSIERRLRSLKASVNVLKRQLRQAEEPDDGAVA